MRRRLVVDVVRWTLAFSILLMGSFTIHSIGFVQRTLDDQEHNGIPALESPVDPQSWGMESYRKSKSSLVKNSTRTSLPAVSKADIPRSSLGNDCLVHAPFVVNASQNRVSDPSKTLLEQSTTFCPPLRRDWRDLPPLSDIARQIRDQQSNCSLPLANHVVDNLNGIGSHLKQWSQSMCMALQGQMRVRTLREDWLWLDQEHCRLDDANERSPMLCYFPESEFRCGENESIPNRNLTDPRASKKRNMCKRIIGIKARAAFRAASTEYLFHEVGDLVIQEARRQAGVVFGMNGAPSDLITVHIRWGDKFWEMKLPTIDEYVKAVQILNNNASTANIFLATEDPKALQEFRAAAPSTWMVFEDVTLKELNAFRPKKGNRASWATRNTKGRAGLVALGSLLVALEANKFVLTTKSNWSTLMNELRKNIVDRICGNCTQIVDLRPGEW